MYDRWVCIAKVFLYWYLELLDDLPVWKIEKMLHFGHTIQSLIRVKYYLRWNAQVASYLVSRLHIYTVTYISYCTIALLYIW